MSHRQHFTTRRAFISTLGFGSVALYGAWAAYGAAPLPFFRAAGKDSGSPHSEAAQGHGGHGAAGAMTPEEFLRRHEEFVAQFSQPDGSVAVGRMAAPAAGPDRHAPAAGHDSHGAGQHGAADAYQPSAQGGSEAALAGHGETQPVDLYLHAYRFGFAPDDIRLEAGKPYRLRMMASDITHGASLQLGRGSRITRLRPNVVTEQTITFNRPGPVLIYCTVFCGAAHDAMKARILVA
jgi:cytochrome c oxidase subunit II